MIERLVFGTVALIAAAAVVPVIVPSLVTVAIVGTVCFAVVRAVRLRAPLSAIHPEARAASAAEGL